MKHLKQNETILKHNETKPVQTKAIRGGWVLVALLVLLVSACDQPAAEADAPAEARSASEQSDESGATAAAQPASVVLDVEGMTCVSCANSIVETLEADDGVQGADVDFGARQAHVDYDEGQLSVDEIIALIEANDSGFSATPAD